jgi:16S rRNA (uracil1498-N3)-methyltransferase
VVPHVDDPISVDAAPRIADPAARGLLLDPEADRGALSVVLREPPPARVWLAVGPEGGFTSGETGELRARGFRPVELGPRILRTEHAAGALLAVLQAAWGDLGTRGAG